MAVEWYLMNSPPNRYSGFEDDDFAYFGTEGFNELLYSCISDEVTLYNYDLSVSETARCIVRGNIADTTLKSLNRVFIFNIGTVKAGMYVFFDNSYWLIIGYPGNNKIYEKVTAVLCQYQIKWQNSKGNIIKRWVNLTTASKYDIGETNTQKAILTTNNLTILIPNDTESMELERKRVFIDKNTKNPSKVFKITRNDDVLYEYNSHGGVLSFIADKTELNPKTDNTGLGICGYIPPAPSCGRASGLYPVPKIIYNGKPAIKLGGNFKRARGVFVDFNGDCAEGSGLWIVDCEFKDKLIIVSNGNQIKIKAPDIYEDLIGRSFKLIFSDKTKSVFDKMTFTIESCT